ncbi:MAG: type II toxin-antitoxin system VapB family antitoxin [Ignavibacteriaceae bacterium]|nr:type II toxin-antitoxin system VapB family antitoxin [Ignavibacteriaceae bacterium]
MKTLIDIDDKLMAKALKASGLDTKKAVVHAGLALVAGAKATKAKPAKKAKKK